MFRSRISGADPAEHLAGPLPVRYVLEERQDAEHLVSAGLIHLGDPVPHDLGGVVEPGVADAAGVQRGRDHAGGDERGGMPLLRDPPGRVRPAHHGRLDEGRAALGGRHRREPVAGAPDQVLVPRVGFVHDAQRHRYGGRLAARRAAVRFERVTEAAVVIAVGGHRVADRRGRAVLEQPLKAAPVEHPGVSGDERGRPRLKSGVFIGP